MARQITGCPFAPRCFNVQDRCRVENPPLEQAPDAADGHEVAFFYPAEGDDAVAYHKTAAALSPFSKTGLTDIEDVVPFIRHLVSDGWWITGQTILINGGYTTK